MLKDADPEYFSGIYIVCGYTDLRYGIDSLAAILERKFHAKLFVPNTLFLFCDKSASKIKGLLWEGDGFLRLFQSAVHSFRRLLCFLFAAFKALHGIFLFTSIFIFCFLTMTYAAFYSWAISRFFSPLLFAIKLLFCYNNCM